METSTIVALLTLFLGGGGVIGYLLKVYLPSPEDKAKAKAAEQANEKDALTLPAQRNETLTILEGAIKEMVTKQVESTRKTMKLEQDKAFLELQVEIKQGQIDDYKNDFQRFFKEQGASEQRERDCQRQLSILRSEMEAMRAQIDNK